MTEPFARVYTILMIALFVSVFAAADTTLFRVIVLGMGIDVAAWCGWEWLHRNDPVEAEDE